MRFLSNLSLPITIVLIVGFTLVLGQMVEDKRARMAANAPTASPWDGLTADEYQLVAKAVRAAHGDDVLFARISLKQPDKAAALAWTPGEKAARSAEVAFSQGGAFYLTDVDLQNATLGARVALRDGQPMFSGSGELEPLVMTLSENPQVLAALAKRGLEKGEALCLPRTVGQFFADLADVRNNRIVRLDCFNITGSGALGVLPSSNLFARPVEGLSILYDMGEAEIVEITDSFEGRAAPPHDIDPAEYHAGAIKTRPALNPVVIARPQGVNFTMTGSRIDWQGWQFHLRFDPRQGTVLNRIGHRTPMGFRSVAYEIAMSEMFVPYHDNDPHWFYRAYFDMGEYGFGNLASPLQKADCPAGAVYHHVTLHLPDGTPYQADNRVCIFEHDPGHPAWRHHESLLDGVPGMQTHQSRIATELVVRMVSTIGNYDYFQDYVFGQDGRLRIRLISTGVDAVKAVISETMDAPGAVADTATGTLIAPHRVGVNHDHYFNYRIDMDVDGTRNDFSRLLLRAVRQEDTAPRSGIWAVLPQRVTNEKQAQTQMRPERPALLMFNNTARKNAMGYATGYQLIMPNVRPLVRLSDETFKRALFLQNNLWVTRFKRDEIFAAGVAVNQSAPALGLPQYIADNEQIEKADLVGWATIGFHHVPMAEDWPVMPAKIDEIILKPRNFFDRNPAIDLPQ